jgi:hypothetical protein
VAETPRAPGTIASFIGQGEKFAGSEVVLIDHDLERLALVKTLAESVRRASPGARPIESGFEPAAGALLLALEAVVSPSARSRWTTWSGRCRRRSSLRPDGDATARSTVVVKTWRFVHRVQMPGRLGGGRAASSATGLLYSPRLRVRRRRALG